MTLLLALDPGEIHCGVAEFDVERTRCLRAVEFRPEVLYRMIRRRFRNDRFLRGGPKGGRRGRFWSTVVLEEFRLYPFKAQQLGFSQLKTVEVIGVVRYFCTLYKIRLVEQPALIKKPTEGHVRALGIRLKSELNKTGGHARDAELHGLHYLMRGQEK